MQIITCGCGDTDKFAESAFRIIFPNTPVPLITHKPLDKENKKYALLFTDEGVWDLMKGVQIQ